MPKTRPEGPHGGPEPPFPKPCPSEQGKIKSDPELAPAEGEGAVQPCRQQRQTDPKLAEPGKSAVERTEHIRRRTQQHPLQKAAQKPGPDEPGRHRRQPRVLLGSS